MPMPIWVRRFRCVIRRSANGWGWSHDPAPAGGRALDRDDRPPGPGQFADPRHARGTGRDHRRCGRRRRGRCLHRLRLYTRIGRGGLWRGRTAAKQVVLRIVGHHLSTCPSQRGLGRAQAQAECAFKPRGVRRARRSARRFPPSHRGEAHGRRRPVSPAAHPERCARQPRRGRDQ